MNGTVALVAGASGGIGRAIAHQLISAGAEVILLGRNAERLADCLPPDATARSSILAADLTDASSMEIISAELSRRGRLNSLILSSGIYERSDDPVILRRQFEANVIGPYALIRITLPMLARNDGHIIFVNSTQGLRASATVGQFAATMHAMRAIADALRDEVNAHGVRVTSLYLGRTAGDRQKKIFEFEGRNYPPERLLQPGDVADTVCHVLQTPRTVEITEITIRPMLKT